MNALVVVFKSICVFFIGATLSLSYWIEICLNVYYRNIYSFG